jgi:Fur family iron response transcriptional regulator
MPKTEQIVSDKLAQASLRPTRQRISIGKKLWGCDKNRHVTAEQLHQECQASSAPVSMATVYNTLHQFVDAGLIKEVVVDSGCSYFDTNMKPHHHFYYESSGQLEDIDADLVDVASIPTPSMASGAIQSVELIIRVA